MNIEELLPCIEKRPQMYFREKNVFFLETFLGGFFLNEHYKDDFRYDFYNWLQKKFNLENNSTWADFIEIISKNENLNSVDVFFREYYLFKKENK
ncbi:hypothetical protein V2E39_12685 [Chryseobacterium arthrosphaerae]|uniref:Uncharacterized protein n=1 Tax=Chryseobacterium arthrosphaerae TaxID=651561 RepID=A0A1B8ZTH4_9FLAO|nr:hypothetical protein [Chryseobacterium arthrosphaerae]OCA74888.1 hypothetical protein BBI00_11335 [Chryseobacterium arthrosphaerae]